MTLTEIYNSIEQGPRRRKFICFTILTYLGGNTLYNTMHKKLLKKVKVTKYETNVQAAINAAAILFTMFKNKHELINEFLVDNEGLEATLLLNGLATLEEIKPQIMINTDLLPAELQGLV